MSSHVFQKRVLEGANVVLAESSVEGQFSGVIRLLSPADPFAYFRTAEKESPMPSDNP